MLQAAGERGCVGVTTGQVLCACVGSKLRAEYTVFGDAINLAARLMGCATVGGHGVLCDFRTRELGKDAASFLRLAPMVVKVGMVNCGSYRCSIMWLTAAVDAASSHQNASLICVRRHACVFEV